MARDHEIDIVVLEEPYMNMKNFDDKVTEIINMVKR